MFTLILFLVVLSLLVFVHEWGHFIAAKKFGMKVYEFGFGFPPRAIGIYKDPKTKKWVLVKKSKTQDLHDTVGGRDRAGADEYPATVYSLNWLPLGGFVKIKGENGEEAQSPDSFGYHKAWKKAVVLVAGVTMNFLLAWLLLGVGFMSGLPTDITNGVDGSATIVGESSIVVQQVSPDSPAKNGGIEAGDKILSVNDVDIENSKQLIALVGEQSNQELVINLSRRGELYSVLVTPTFDEVEGRARMGVMIADAAIVKYPWYSALFHGFVSAVYGVVGIVNGFFLLIQGLIFGQGLVLDVAGPVGIASIIGDSARLGWTYLLNVTAMISLSLAVINILPIPALDGGRLLFVIIEKISKKPVPKKYEQIAHTIGFVLLMGLIIIVSVRDVVKIFS
ncbi:MAG: RIP metalloprotease RseP [Candidatus Magasanikbacteria bacterium]|nr:RIP metalloprotease RseP [Candidatus Magasanikbacteria bacterium]